MTKYQFQRFIHSKRSFFGPVKFILFLALSAIIPLITADSGYSAQVTLQWYPNSEADLAGYRIYIGYSSGNYQSWADAGNNTSIVFTNAEEGTTYFYAATAYGIYGN